MICLSESQVTQLSDRPTSRLLHTVKRGLARSSQCSDVDRGYEKGYPLKCCSYGHHSTRWGREMLQRAVTIPSWPANVQLRLETLDFVLGLHQLIHQPPIFLLSLFAEPSCIAPDHGSPYCFVPSGDFAQSAHVHICINVWILRSWLRDTWRTNHVLGGRPRSDLRDILSTADSMLGFQRVRQIGHANKIICYLFY